MSVRLTHVAVLCALLGCRPRATLAPDVPASAPATLAIRHARIYTGDSNGRFVAAMAARGEAIVYAGDEAGLQRFIGAGTIVHDLGGRLVLAGLHDVHQHTLEAHLQVVDCTLDPRVVDPEAYVPVVGRCREASGTDWVLGWGYSVLHLLEARRAPRLILDAAIRDRPVAIMEETSHSTWVNTRALEVLGITATTPDPPGGIILRDRDGRPNGVLLDAAGELPWERALAPNDTLRAANLAALQAGLRHNSEFGITSAVDARVYTSRGHLDAYEALAARGAMTVRMTLSLWASPLEDDDRQIARLRPLFRDDGGRLRVRQVKFYADGLLQNTTAALLEPYATPDTFGSNVGLFYFSPARLERYLRALQAVGFDAHIHAIGDRAVRGSLDAILAARAAPGGAGARHRLTHVELTAPADVARFVAAGVAVDMQLGPHTEPSRLAETAEFVGGPRTRERAWVLGDLWRAGAVVALSSDFDVGELNPFIGMARSLQRGAQSLPDVAAAVRAYTTNAAYITRSERRTGSLEVGKLADFVVVDRDLFRIPVADIARAQVLWTVVGGAEVYRRAGFRP